MPSNSSASSSSALSAASGAPPISSGRAAHRARVIERHEVAPRHFRLRLAAPRLAQRASPGQFVHVLTHLSDQNTSSWNYDPLLRRAFSLMSVDAPAGTFEVLFRVEGRGTALLSGARVGDTLDLIGPLGKPFDLSPLGVDKGYATGHASHHDSSVFHVKQQLCFANARAIVVGGGVGVPPLVFLAKTLADFHVAVQALVGARTGADVLGQSDFAEMGVAVGVATDDGSAGHRGRVTDLLQGELKRDARAVVYACGPWPMLRAVAEVCRVAHVPCQVSLEEAMPCGVGVCNGCVVRAKAPFVQAPFVQAGGEAEPTEVEAVGDEWSPYRQYRRICVEGPACWAHEIDWEDGGR